MTVPVSRRGANALGVIVALLAVLLVGNNIRRWFTDAPGDFVAFYAAGQVATLDRQLPYRVEPLLDRERRLHPNAHLTVATPSPLPPYDLAWLAPLARLPLRVALVFLAAATLAAAAVTSWVVARCSPLNAPTAVAVVFLGIAYDASQYGQIAPIAIAALAVATWALRAERPVLAGVALLISLIEPHMAAAALIAAFLFVPKARLTLALGIVTLVVAGTLAFGPGAWLDFVHTLPLQAASEVRFPAQYGLTWLLVALGVPSGPALAAGTASTIVLALASFAIVGRNRERAVRSGAVVLLPATLAAVGGTYLHPHQLVIGLLAAILYARPTRRPVDATWALGIFVIPFVLLVTFEQPWPIGADAVEVAAAALATWLAVSELGASQANGRSRATVATGALVAVFAVLAIVRARLHFAPLTEPHVAFDPHANASAAWLPYADAIGAVLHQTPYLLAVKAVVWLGLVVASVASIRTLERSESAGGSYETPMAPSPLRPRSDSPR